MFKKFLDWLYVASFYMSFFIEMLLYAIVAGIALTIVFRTV